MDIFPASPAVGSISRLYENVLCICQVQGGCKGKKKQLHEIFETRITGVGKVFTGQRKM